MTSRARRLMPPKACHALYTACLWCAITGGAVAFAAGVMLGAMRFGATASAFAASTLALFAMAFLPAALARRFVERATVPVAASLVVTMAAMTAASTLARADSTQGVLPFVLALAGLAMLTTVWPRLTAADIGTTRAFAQKRRTTMQHVQQGFAATLRGSGPLLAPALLAGVSSGMLARFQFFAICGAGPFSLTQLAASLGAAIGLGALAERVDYRYALLTLFALRSALLAALTLDALAPWAVFAAPAFAVLDALTLPTLMRGGRAAQAGCPGIAHHAGMLAGAALATTSWGFSQGFHTLFLAGTALNLMCAYALAVRRGKPTPTPIYADYPANPALVSGGGIDIR
jgi:hypothetical protein